MKYVLEFRAALDPRKAADVLLEVLLGLVEAVQLARLYSADGQVQNLGCKKGIFALLFRYCD